MKIRLFLILSLLVTTLIGYSQEKRDSNYQKMFLLSGSLQFGFPLNEFRENVSKLAIGGGGSFLVMINKKFPTYAGFDLAGLIYDSESDDFILIDGNEAFDARLTTRTSIFKGHGVLRIMPPTNIFIIPYFDGMLGFKNLYTKTEIRDTEIDESIESYVEDGDWALSYGGAIGIQIPPLKWRNDEFLLLLDLKCAWLKGPAADYRVRIEDLSGITVEEPIDVFEIKNSTTDMLITHIGLTFFF